MSITVSNVESLVVLNQLDGSNPKAGQNASPERLHWNNRELFEPTRSVSLPPFPQIGYSVRSVAYKGAVCFALLKEHCITHKMPHPNKACNCRTRKMNVQNCLNCYDIDEVYRGRFQLLSWKAISGAECSNLRKRVPFRGNVPILMDEVPKHDKKTFVPPYMT